MLNAWKVECMPSRSLEQASEGRIECAREPIRHAHCSFTVWAHDINIVASISRTMPLRYNI